MLRLIKWAYRLAQQTERQRIAGILNDHRRYRDSPNNIARRLFGKDFDDLTDKKKDTLKFEQAVDERVNDIIDAITRPQEHESTSYSLLYPREGK